jgi:hypothetical protein
MGVIIDTDVLEYLMAIRGLCGQALARIARVSDATVSNTRAGKPISIDSAKRIARALALTPVDEDLRQLLGKGPAGSDDASGPSAGVLGSIAGA